MKKAFETSTTKIDKQQQNSFEARQVSIKYNKHLVLNNLNFKLIENKITAILGPNGSGKSTLLKTLSGLIHCQSGEILINSQNINQISRPALAKILSILPQSPESPNDITVRQLVQYGRYIHSSWFNKHAKEDNEYVKWALAATNLTALAENFMHELSGGERQRVWIAMSLAQNSNYLFLDEPTTYLDIKFQFEVLHLLKELNCKENKTIIMVLHEIQHALNYADYILLLQHGEICAYGTVSEIIKSGAIDKVFNVKVKELEDNGEKHIVICNHKAI